MAQLPIFPLGTVLFPGAVLPLQIFEPRYIALLRDLVEQPVEDRRFGVVALRRGNEVGIESVPELARIGTVAQVMSIRQGAGGSTGVMFRIETEGRGRFRLESYATGTKPYYVATVTWLEDEVGDPEELRAAANDAAAAFEAYQLAVTGGTRPLDLPAEELAYAMVRDFPLPIEDRQAVLEAGDPATRLCLLARLLRRETVLVGGMRFAPTERQNFGAPSQN